MYIYFISFQKENKMKKLTKEERLIKKKEWQQKLVNKGTLIKNNKKNKLCPRCIYSDQNMVLSSEGYLSPCCWLDDELYRNQPYVNDFFQPHLNIENNKNIEDIFNSKEWKNFWDMLINHPEDAPPVCYEYCASKKGDQEIIEEKNNDIGIIRVH